MRHLPGYAVWGLCALLVVGASSLGQDPSPDPGPTDEQEALATVDSLRTAREFRAALARLDELSRRVDETVQVLWRQSILWSDLAKASDSEARALTFNRQALDVAETAVETDATHAWAHVAKSVAAGRMATMTNSNRESIRLSREVKEHADRALALDSELGAAYHVRARWHREVGDLNFVQRLVVKTVYGGLPDASTARAVEDFRTAIGLETRAYHHLELGKTYEKMDRRGDAVQQYRRALEAPRADPFDPEYKREARAHLSELE
ncbi:MAG: hypothetical protein V5A20_13650 [Salinibacter sp.]|uniref:hypothetical protein n=1 Tax=Salinibacter sp. TaxID=2065818 RepID=UPI002FC36BCB